MKNTCKKAQLLVKLQPLSLRPCQNINFITAIFNLFPYILGPSYLSIYLSIYILCYSRYIAIHFHPLKLVSLGDRWSTFYKDKDESFDQQHFHSVAIIKKERETWKVQCERTR